jgi:diaminopimelate epimerase
MEIKFQKMHGTLNDFVVFHDLSGEVKLTPQQVAAICERRGGVGADGVIVVRPSSSADFFMDYTNADGSVAEMCGNGIRCLAKYVYDNGLTTERQLKVDTRAGIKSLELFTGPEGKIESVRVDMGAPVFDPARIPVSVHDKGSSMVEHEIKAGDRIFHASILSMGNPHCVIVVDENLDPLPLRYGPTIEKHPLFPAKTNVEFIRVLSPDHIVMRVWERGSGETFSCGTGACASAVAARVKGLVDSGVSVELPGGDLHIDWEGNNNPVLMTGSVVLVFDGSITV